jgi:putative membrane protein
MDHVLGTFVLRPYVFAFLVVFVAAGAADLGGRRTLAFGAILWSVAWTSEFASTRIGVPFGFYHYTEITRGRELYIADVPLMDSLSFTFLGYASFCLARFILAARPASRATTALLAGFLMMALDIVIDPLAVRGDRWFLGRIFYYPSGGVYFGVPLSNFAGWWLVGLVGVGGYLCAVGDGRGRPLAGVALYYAVLAFNLVVTGAIGEWSLLAAGLGVHAAVAAVVTAARWTGARKVRDR